MTNETDLAASWLPDEQGLREKTSRPEEAYGWGQKIEALAGLHEMCQALPFRGLTFRFRGKTAVGCRLLLGPEKATVIASSNGDGICTSEIVREIERNIKNEYPPEKVEFRLKTETGHHLTPYKAEIKGGDVLISFV